MNACHRSEIRGDFWSGAMVNIHGYNQSGHEAECKAVRSKRKRKRVSSPRHFHFDQTA